MTFRIATFNVLNLNAEGHEFIGRRTDRPYDGTAFAAKTATIAGMLDRIGADVVGFQEVFSEAALRQVVGASPKMAGAGVFAPLAQVATGADGLPVPGLIDPANPVSHGPHVGLATRLPLSGPVRMIAHFPEGLNLTVPAGLHRAVESLHHIGIRRFERPVLRAEIEVPGLPGLVVFVAHLKSKGPKFLAGEDVEDPLVIALGSLRSLVVRAAEAAALKGLVAEARRDWVGGHRRPVIVMGDLNDDIRAVTTGMIIGPRPFAGPGRRADRRDFARRVADLMLPAQELAAPAGPSHTHVFDGVGSVLDLILFSVDFARVEGHQRARVTATEVVNDHLDPPQPYSALPQPAPWESWEPKDPLPGREPSERLRSPKTGLDHGVVVAEVEPGGA
ncbi:MAG TPA: endonuclease/exonuclease/phosphatase family protein [Paracoccaceae bacterium]|nr:endonuclease/exonuclease/phosphatase family protein [Paracoccaceae bacterium]